MKRKLLAFFLALLMCQGLLCPARAVVEEIAAVKVDEVTGYSASDSVYTVRQDGLYGFYRADGTVLAEPDYSYAEDFQNGMAVVSPAHETSCGYLSLSGKITIPARYSKAFPFVQDRAFAVREQSGILVLLNLEGQELASFPDAVLQPDDRLQFSEGLAVIPVHVPAEEEDGAPVLAYQVIDLDGREVCVLSDAYVDYQNGYHDGRIAAASSGEWVESGDGLRFQGDEGSWGYRDNAGELAVEYQYDEAAPFSEGLAGVGLKDAKEQILYGWIDPMGSVVVPVEYDGFVSCTNGAGAFLRNGRWAYVKQDGQMLTGFRYDGLSTFSEGLALVQSGGRRSVVDTGGTVLFAVDGEKTLPCSGGVIPVQNAEGLWGIYDKDGNVLVDFEYDRAFHWDGYLWLKRGGLWRVYLTEDVLADRAAAAAEAAADAEADAGTVTVAAAVGTFSDVAPDAYYAQAVTWATDSDIVTGTGGGLFSPERLCTTGEIVVCLWRAAGRPETGLENPFVDVSPNHYYYQAALWAYASGLVEGGTFAAAEPCTRAMVVNYLWGLAGRPYGLTDVFSDVPADAEYAQAVAWAVEHQITEGNADGLFLPDSICSRGQIVTFLYRVYG